MKPIDNTNVLKTLRVIDYSAMLPALTYAYNAGAKTITITEAGDIPDGDALKNIDIQIHDQMGGTVHTHIAAMAGNTGAVDVSSLDLSKGFSITATYVTNAGYTANGGVYETLAAAGALGSWNKGESAAEAEH